MKRSTTVLLLACALLLIVLEIARPTYSQDGVKNLMISTIISRSVGGALFLSLIKERFPRLFTLKTDARALICVLPALAVAINNAPIIGLATKSATVDADGTALLLFAIQSLAVGAFEEAAFRGYLFPLLLERSKSRSVFFSTVATSAVFAAVHIVNLFSGASPAAVLLQVGYSFLIGGMCAIVLLKTRCIWICILLHSIYNFGGTLIPTLGHGRVWDPITVTVTAVLGVSVLAVMLKILHGVTPEEASALYKNKKNA